MSLTAYAYIKAEKQGVIKGFCKQKGRENLIPVLATSHSVISPRDSQTGQPQGKRQHKPIVLTTEVDPSTALLFQALCQGEDLPEVKLTYYSTVHGLKDSGHGQGKENIYYTIDLEHAQISSLDFRQPHVKITDASRLAEYVEIALVYQKITWTWKADGKSGSDDWNAPAGS